MSRRLALLLASLGAVVLGGGTPAAADTSAPVNGRLLVATGHPHEYDLEALDLRGGDRLHLIPFGGDISGAYSPDGTKIAFMTNYDGDLDICVMNADGTGIHVLTRNSSADASPSWSPDGKKIAFTSNRDGDFDIYTMNADGSNQQNLTNEWSQGADDNPHWSPDGTGIAFNMESYGGGWDIWEIRFGATWLVPLLATGADEWFDSWAPDGKHFLVESNANRDFDIYSVETPTNGVYSFPQPKVLADDDASQGAATWSPDGKQIAYSGNRDGDWEVYVMNADGSGQRQVTHNTVDDIVDDWQPLHDVSAPKVRALVSDVRPRARGRLRFRTFDDSGRTSVYVLVYDGRRLIGYINSGQMRRIAGHTYSVVWRAPQHLSRKARFCVSAYDPSGNESRDSCAPIRVHV